MEHSVTETVVSAGHENQTTARNAKTPTAPAGN